MTDRETTTIEVSHAVWKELNARRDRPGQSFDDILRGALGLEGDTGGTVKEPDDVLESAARHANPTDEATPSHPSPVRDRANVIERVADSWDDDGRVDDRRAAADAALALLFERGQLSKSEALAELLPEHSVDGQSDETWWVKNVRPVVQEVATYLKGVNAYVLDEGEN